MRIFGVGPKIHTLRAQLIAAYRMSAFEWSALSSPGARGFSDRAGSLPFSAQSLKRWRRPIRARAAPLRSSH